MKNYNEEYYFLEKVDGDGISMVTPTEETDERQPEWNVQPLGSAPLFFFSAHRDEPEIKNLPKVLFCGNDLIVCSSIRESLIQKDIPGIYLHPAVYISKQDVWREDYWFITFGDRLDCWDREESDYDKESNPIVTRDGEMHLVYSFSLDANILDEIPLRDRLIFKMGGSLDAMVVCHRSIAGMFKVKGAKLTLVTDY